MDAKRGMRKGSWGMGSVIWDKPLGNEHKPMPELPKISLAYNYTDYREMIGSPKNENEALITDYIIGAVFLTNLFLTEISSVEELALGTVFRISLWLQTGFAKFYWNNNPSGFRLQRRQTEKRPSNFQSGPDNMMMYSL